MVRVGAGYHYGGKNMKVWTKEEDTKLVDALMELHESRKFTGSKNEFIPGYLQAIEQLLNASLPNKGLKVNPHIKSRLKTMKNNFNIVHDMLAGTYMSGFAWDPQKSCVIADNQVWDEYIKIQTHAAQFRNRPFPHYDKLCVIFGKDRATGKIDNQKRHCVEAGNKRKREEGKDLSETCQESLEKLKDAIETSVESLEKLKNTIENFWQTFIVNLETGTSEGINAVNDMMDQAMTQIKDLPGLTVDERLIAMSVIGRSAPLSQMFDRLDGNGKIRMAQMVADGSIS